MSGIVGIYYLDGRPVEREILGRMVDRLAHRGADGAGIWCEASVGLAHRMLWTTPESFLEKLPLVSSQGHWVLTADARIDNREELIAALGLNQCPVEKITDSQLILAAYERWGNGCPQRLLGDFAFAIWDQRQQVLFCARDHSGVKPFYYYYSPGKFFAFASEIKGVLGLPEVSRRVNQAKVGIYLCQLTGFASLKSDTFYQDIRRLPPAQWLEVSERGLNFQSYWDLDAAAQTIQFQSDGEYVEAFRERFTQAVACRLRSAYPVVSTLSGGLDSSSVSCVARNLLRGQNLSPNPSPARKAGGVRFPLLTVYGDCGVPSTDEKGYVNAVLAQGGFQHSIATVRNPIGSAQTVTPCIDRPVQMPTPAMLLASLQSVQQQGARVVLTGHDGDTIVSHGQDYPAELIELGKWDCLKDIVISRLDKGKESADKKRVEYELYQYVLPYFNQLVKDFKIKGYWQGLSKVSRNWSFSLRGIVSLPVRSIYYNLRQVKWQAYNSKINRDFARQVGLNGLLQDELDYQLAYLPSEYLNHHRGITSDNMQDINEQVDGMSAALGIEPRHPFLDKRVVELCLAVPAHLKFCNGFGRGVMRRAMKDILPEEVRRRGSKVDFYGFIIPEMERDERELIEEVLGGESELSRYIDSHALYQEYREFSKSATPWKQRRRGARMIACAMFLAMWLRQSKDCG
ncbi:MAG: lasso peptide isopeptide bond-forming cyclase [Coleofasciculus sp. B1-GNL1-01]|uniref:lasso peptide isopeptide bond-forming cyclase n=1 Tax=Coleofasciculus sp. B1-GNL1-01 TaxID=3068484 RepID=UPI003300C6A6